MDPITTSILTAGGKHLANVILIPLVLGLLDKVTKAKVEDLINRIDWNKSLIEIKQFLQENWFETTNGNSLDKLINVGKNIIPLATKLALNRLIDGVELVKHYQTSLGIYKQNRILLESDYLRFLESNKIEEAMLKRIKINNEDKLYHFNGLETLYLCQGRVSNTKSQNSIAKTIIEICPQVPGVNKYSMICNFSNKIGMLPNSSDSRNADFEEKIKNTQHLIEQQKNTISELEKFFKNINNPTISEQIQHLDTLSFLKKNLWLAVLLCEKESAETLKQDCILTYDKLIELINKNKGNNINLKYLWYYHQYNKLKVVKLKDSNKQKYVKDLLTILSNNLETELSSNIECEYSFSELYGDIKIEIISIIKNSRKEFENNESYLKEISSSIEKLNSDKEFDKINHPMNYIKLQESILMHNGKSSLSQLEIIEIGNSIQEFYQCSLGYDDYRTKRFEKDFAKLTAIKK